MKVYYVDNYLDVCDAEEQYVKISYPYTKYFGSEIEALYELKEILSKIQKEVQQKIDNIYEERQNNLG